MCSSDLNGNGAAVITDEQADHVRKLAVEVRANMEKFLAWLRVPSVSDIRARDFNLVIEKLEAKRAADAAKARSE